MTTSTLHFIAILFGGLHTVLGVNDVQQAVGSILVLQWQWSFRDVLAIANLVSLGATFRLGARGIVVGLCKDIRC